MADRVKPLKYETPEFGTELDEVPTEVNPTEDFLAAKGISFENLIDSTIWSESGIIKFKDAVLTTAKTLNELRMAIHNSFDNSTNGYLSNNAQEAIEETKEFADSLFLTLTENRIPFMGTGKRLIDSYKMTFDEETGTISLLDGTLASTLSHGLIVNLTLDETNEGIFCVKSAVDNALIMTDPKLGRVGIGASLPTAKLDINSDILRVRIPKTPENSRSAGNKGDFCWDSNYIYICVAENIWKRALLGGW
jgi:hypothetical protein